MSETLNDELTEMVKELIEFDKSNENEIHIPYPKSSLIDELDELGFIETHSKYLNGTYVFAITSKCRTYFDEIEKENKQSIKLKRREIVISVVLIVISVLLNQGIEIIKNLAQNR